MRAQRGFSLIELLLVVAIILIIAAMAIPNFVRSKITANEAAAISSLRTINTAQTTYIVTYPTVGYASNLQQLSMPPAGSAVDSTHAGLIDWVLGCNTQPCPKSGYMFAIIPESTNTPMTAYSTTAVPIAIGRTGNRGFCAGLNEMRYDPAGGSSCTQIVD